jgi:hypothetical protein
MSGIKDVDMLLLALLGVLAAVAFLNHGSLGLGTNPSGSTFNVGYGGR